MNSISTTLKAAQKVMGKRLSRIVLTYTPTAWATATAYTIGERCEPTTANTYVYSCIKAGTSHASTQPTWPTTVGDTVTDNTTKWQNIGLKSQTYTRTGTTARILSIDPHVEAIDTQYATVLLNNSDRVLTDYDIKGFQGIISYGYNTSSGDEYQARPTMWVISQNNYSLRSGRGVTALELIGIPDLLAQDKASDDYEPDTTNTDTVKTIVAAVLGATLTCFNHCRAYTVAGSNYVIDWEDALFNSFQPKDSFKIKFGESRLSVLNRLLSWTRMVKRFRTGAEIHVFSPYRIEDKETWQASHDYAYDDIVEPTTPNGYLYTPSVEGTSGGSEPTWPTAIAGTVTDGSVTWLVAYDERYSLADSEHDFFDKNSRERIVVPGYVKVVSFPDADPAAQYSGTAQDDAYDTYPTELKIQDHRRLRVASNAEAITVATALLRGYQTQAEKGSGLVPMHLGQEVYDFVYLIDARIDDTRSGIIQYIKRRDTALNFDMEFSFAPFVSKPSLLKKPFSEFLPATASMDNIHEIYDDMKAMAVRIDDRLDGMDRRIQSNWETNYFGDKTVYIQILEKGTAVTVADSLGLWTIPSTLNGWLLVDADAVVDTASTNGTPTFQIHNLTDTQDMLSTRITLDINEKNSYTAQAPPVINQSYDDVATGDILRFDCDVAGTSTSGLAFLLRFRRV